MKNSPSHLQQPVLPASVRQAIGIALLASLPAGCTTPKQTNTQAPTIVEVPAATSSSQEPAPGEEKETVVEDKNFTPQKALRAALSEPLQFVAQLDGMDFGSGKKVCLWRNSKVLIRSNYCEKYDRKRSEGTKDQAIMVTIHSPEGKTLNLYAEAPQNKSIYDLQHNEYLSLDVQYMDYSLTDPKYKHSDTPEGYQNRIKQIKSPEKWKNWEALKASYCTMSKNEQVCHGKNEDLEKAMKAFWEEPGEDWYTFVQTLKTLYDQQGFR